MFKEYYAYGISPATTETDNTKFIPNILKLDNDSDFELHYISIIAYTGKRNTRIKIYDSNKSKYITGSNPINITSIGGQIDIYGTSMFDSADTPVSLPYILPTPYLFKKGTNIIIEANNVEVGLTAIQIVLHGTKIREGNSLRKEVYSYEEFGMYSLNQGTGSSAPYSDAITIDNNCDFEVMQLISRGTGWGDTYGTRVDIMDSWNGNQWTNKNAACSIANMTGVASYPFILPVPKLIPKGGSIVVSSVNGAGYLDFVIAGVKLYE